jgi:replicative DNA helicase
MAMIQEHDIRLQRNFISAAFELKSVARDRLSLIPRDWFTDFASRTARDAILDNPKLDCIGYAHTLVANGTFQDHREALATFPSGMANLPRHLDFVVDQLRESFVRHSVECFTDAVARASGADLTADERMGILETCINAIRLASESGQGNYNPFSVGCLAAAAEIDEVQESIRNLTASKTVPTGIDSLDAALFGGGFHPGQIVMVGARPGVGKTSFMLTAGRNMAMDGRKVGFISLEMTAKELAMVAAQQGANMSTQRFYREIVSEYETKAMFAGFSEASELPIVVDDSSRLTVEQVAARIKQMARVDGCEVVFVDYAQRIAFQKGIGDTVEQLNHISTTLTQAAKDTQIVLVALAQLNRGAAGEVPQLKDFKGSGQFEQDANTALLLHRPKANEPGNIEDMEIHVAKQRRGLSQIHVNVTFHRHTQRIS